MPFLGFVGFSFSDGRDGLKKEDIVINMYFITFLCNVSKEVSKHFITLKKQYFQLK